MSDPHPHAFGVRELRLALVCYGGVSLAIYMHGVTKEVHKLLLASAAYDRDQETNPFDATLTEHAYWDLLARMHRGRTGMGTAGVRTHVVVDIISGTSAGGINGICLAKAIALNRSQDALKTLWFERGDIKQLAASGRWMPLAVRAPWLTLRSILTGRAPLRGDEMCRWLHSAFVEMDRTPSSVPDLPSLLPAGRTLELFVTVTDFQGYRRELPIYDPRVVTDVAHRHAFVFRHSAPGQTDLDAAGNHVLAFAARATSSFPGAFSPLTFDDYQRYFTPAPHLAKLTERQFAVYSVNGADPGASAFVDGGVLNNHPFNHAIRAIKAQPAASEVVRRLLYIEPDPVPDRPPDLGPAASGQTTAGPAWFATIWAGLSTIPASQPVLDDLTDAAERNQIVRRIRDIIETSFRGICTYLVEVAQATGLDLASLDADSPAAIVASLRERLEEAAVKEAGYAYATYLRLRLRFVLDGYADMISGAMGFPPQSYPSRFVQTIAGDWATAVGLLSQDPAQWPAQKDFLQTVDLDYQDRRLRFIIAALSWWYRDVGQPGFPTRADLDAAKKRLYEHVANLGALVPQRVATAGLAVLERAFPRAEVQQAARGQDREYLAHHRTDLDDLYRTVGDAVRGRVADMEVALYADLIRMSVGWAPEVRRDLLVRYLGFPFWDILVYPLQAFSGVNERDHVEVVRISPFDATLLDPRGAAKLQGTGLMHFAAFFRRDFRENDYLWGRLDAAERLVSLLLDDPEEPGIPPNPDECRNVFLSILREERGALTTIGETLDRIEARARVKDLMAPIG